jgi:hypothetical protein
MAARFMSEALRQQLQQHNYLVQAKVRHPVLEEVLEGGNGCPCAEQLLC